MSDPTPSDTSSGTPAALPGAGTGVEGVVPPPGSHPVLRYTAARFALLLAVGAVLYVLQVRGVWLLLFAFLISGLIAMVALSRTREGAAYGITSAVRGLNEKIDASSRAEDGTGAVAATVATGTPVTAASDAVEADVATADGRSTADEVAGDAAAGDATAGDVRAADVPLDDWDDPAPR